MPINWLIQLIHILSVTCIAVSGYAYHAGTFSDDISTANLIIPRKVDEHGHHISHSVNHFHELDDDSKLHYHIDIHNETLHIELESVHDFIAPLMIIERHRRDTRTRKKHTKKRNCHYQGRVRGDANSNVAVSACDGLAGLLKTKSGDYYIEPSRRHAASRSGHPHVVFQRSALKFKQPYGQLRKKWRTRRKNRKKHAASNCGTREPKRPAETRIEWQPQGKIIVQGSRKTRKHRLQKRKEINRKWRRQKQKAKATATTTMTTPFTATSSQTPPSLSHADEHQLAGGNETQPNAHNHINNRSKRSISSPRHVEALVVADSSMVAFHQDDYVETYLLTIMNMVSSLYKDPAIGNSIKVVVVRIVLLEEDESHPDFNVTHVAENNLQNFCRWQRLENPKDDNDPHHHDVAILITRKDICSTNGCTTLGVANVGGMCRPDRSCSVNEDNGITLAHTITHELGHNFGMYHDTEKTGCDSRAGAIVHVMTPSFEADTVQVSWSNCSRRDITHFLDQGLGKCLDDAPEEEDEFSYPELPPGAMYNADLQCRLQFNTTDELVRVCSKSDEICSQLWCMVNDICVTQMRPAAPGTHCGKHKWCQNQKCIPIEEQPDPVDGGWGNWDQWTVCSRKCGGGVSMQQRQCDHPTPEYGGAFCIGERIRYKTCNVDACAEDEPSFRAQQCASFNNETFRGKQYDWLPYFDSHDACELFCTDSEDTLIVPWGDSAIDGTPCNIGTNDMCISGICRKVGCDWTVDSNKTEDHCGVCGGDGETCTTIKGEFNKKMNTSDGYFDIMNIPSGSRHILIEELAASKNYISLRNAASNESYLNANRLILMPGEFAVGKSMGLYERDDEQEKIKIPGPIQHEMTLSVLVRGKSKSPGIKYEYTLSMNSSKVPVFTWKLGDWAACSATCGGGTQRRFPICHEDQKGIVDEENCWSSAEGSRPSEKLRVCNADPCPVHWWVGPWQLCPVTCRKHGQPEIMKKRSIMCVDHNEMALSDLRCNIDSRPVDIEPCAKSIPYCNSDDDNSENNIIE